MNNRNHVCPTCRTVRRVSTDCSVCSRAMRRVNHVPKRSDDAAWARIAVELRDRDEYEAAWAWRTFIAREQCR